MIREDVGVEAEDGGRVEEVEKRGVVLVVLLLMVLVTVVVVLVMVVLVVVVVVKMITCLVVWQPSQDGGWAALGVGDKAGEGVKNIVKGVDKEEGEV